MRIGAMCVLFLFAGPAAAAPLFCAGVVSPELAYPDRGGVWHGLEIDLCQAIAKRAGLPMRFTPVLQDTDTPPPGPGHDVVFLPVDEIPAGYGVGPVIFNDFQALMVPAGAKARRAADLGNASICVEPGSPEDFNLIAYFQAHRIPLREFVFQEPDEMHDAYEAGRCDAITARQSLLIGVRANAYGARRNDVILPDRLGDNPISAATPAGETAWAATVAAIIRNFEESNHDPQNRS